MSDPILDHDEQEKSIRMLSKDVQKGMQDPHSKEGGVISDNSLDVDQSYFDQQRNMETEMNRFQKILGGSPRRMW